MLKYLSKFAMDILPSVVATIIGAYIVNHYIVSQARRGAPVAAAVSSADPKKADRRGEVRCQAGRDIVRRRQHPPSRASRPRASPKRRCSRRPPPKGRRSCRKAAGREVRRQAGGDREHPASTPVVTAGSAARKDAGRQAPTPPQRRRAGYRAPPAEAAAAPRRASRRQRSGARGDRAAARHERGRRVRRKPPASRMRPVSLGAGRAARRVGAAGSAAAAADHGLHAAAETFNSPPDSHGGHIRLRGATIRTVRPRRPTFRRRPGRRSICGPRRPSRQRGRHTNGRRRHAVGGEVGVSRGLAEIRGASP